MFQIIETSYIIVLIWYTNFILPKILDDLLFIILGYTFIIGVCERKAYYKRILKREEKYINE